MVSETSRDDFGTMEIESDIAKHVDSASAAGEPIIHPGSNSPLTGAQQSTQQSLDTHADMLEQQQQELEREMQDVISARELLLLLSENPVRPRE